MIRRRSVSSATNSSWTPDGITISYCCAHRGLATSWFRGDIVVNDGWSMSVLTVQARHWLTVLSDVHEVFVALETERLCKFVFLVMFVPEEHYIRGSLPAQSSSAYSSSTDEVWIPRDTVYLAGSGAFLQVCRVEGSMAFSCSLDGSRESIKCQVKSAKRHELQCGSKPIPKKLQFK